jgi:hypothetical protein
VPATEVAGPRVDHRRTVLVALAGTALWGLELAVAEQARDESVLGWPESNGIPKSALKQLGEGVAQRVRMVPVQSLFAFQLEGDEAQISAAET